MGMRITQIILDKKEKERECMKKTIKNKIKCMVTVILTLAMLVTLVPATSVDAATAKPAKTTLKKVTQKVLSDNSEYVQVTATWKKVAKNTKGYRVKYTNKTTGKVTISFVNKNTTLTRTRKVKASNGDKIKVTVEAYNKNTKTGKYVYGKVSTAKTITVKGMPTAAEAKKNASTTTTTVSTDTTTSETSGTDNKNTTTNYTKDPSTCSHTNVTTVYESVDYPATSVKVTQAGYDWLTTTGNYVGASSSIKGYDLVLKEAQANVANMNLSDGTNITEKGAIFENVALVAGYRFPSELFYPRTYNGQEVRFWDQKWLEENPEVEQIKNENIKNYRLMTSNMTVPGTSGGNSINVAMCRAAKTEINYGVTFKHLPTNTDTDLGVLGPNYNGIWYGREAVIEFRDIMLKTVDAATLDWYENFLKIGNEMLWDYFRPGVAHEYGADFTVDVNKTYDFDAYNEIFQTDTCKDCGTVTKNNEKIKDGFLDNLPRLEGSGWKADSVTYYGKIKHQYITYDENNKGTLLKEWYTDQ
jgi:hypothetical protein